MLKKAVIIGAVIVTFSVSAYGFEIGPATPDANIDQNVVGIGYQYQKAEISPKDEDVSGGVDIQQNRAYLHLGRGFGMETFDPNDPGYRWEFFLRLGAADFEVEDAFDGRDFDGDVMPFGMVGMRVLFYQGPTFGIGLVAQGGRFGNYDDDETFLLTSAQLEEITGISDLEDMNIRLETTVQSMWEGEIALPIQAKAGPALFYAGPVFYWWQADVEIDLEIPEVFSGEVLDEKYEEKNDLGAFAGIRLDMGAVNFEVEAQYRSDTVLGGMLTVEF